MSQKAYLDFLFLLAKTGIAGSGLGKGFEGDGWLLKPSGVFFKALPQPQPPPHNPFARGRKRKQNFGNHYKTLLLPNSSFPSLAVPPIWWSPGKWGSHKPFSLPVGWKQKFGLEAVLWFPTGGGGGAGIDRQESNRSQGSCLLFKRRFLGVTLETSSYWNRLPWKKGTWARGRWQVSRICLLLLPKRCFPARVLRLLP